MAKDCQTRQPVSCSAKQYANPGDLLADMTIKFAWQALDLLIQQLESFQAALLPSLKPRQGSFELLYHPSKTSFDYQIDMVDRADLDWRKSWKLSQKLRAKKEAANG